MKRIILLAIIGGIVALMISLLIILSMESKPAPIPVVYNHTLEPKKDSSPEPALIFNRTAPPTAKLHPNEDAPPTREEVPTK